MTEYGITDKGFEIKRLDEILEELHSELSGKFGFNTRLDPQSFLNVLITTYGGQISELWEVAQASYYAKYPSTAEGVSLDNEPCFLAIVACELVALPLYKSSQLVNCPVL